MNISIKISILIVVLVGLSSQTFAQISPGKLASYHSKLEGIDNCTKCHDLGKEVSDEKCLSCHDAIHAGIDSARGYHSSSVVKKEHCSKCHSDHHGIEFELVYWKEGIEKFNHEETGYKLEESHKITECRKCHKSKFIWDQAVKVSENISLQRTFLGTNGAVCISCHQDEHLDQLTDKCLDCHDYRKWKPAPGFNHDSTRYALTDKHIPVTCDKCHKSLPSPERPSHLISKSDSIGIYVEYSNLKFNECNACHKDIHEGKLGVECSKCHKVSDFKDLKESNDKFNHSRTDYPLEGAHKVVKCEKCHIDKLTTPLKFTFCGDCHKDTHMGQFADRDDKGVCESCHNINAFLPPDYDIEQHQQSKYPLTGSHLATPCFLCHSPFDPDAGLMYARYKYENKTCAGCHKDIHNDQAEKWMKINGCEYCHTTDDWHKVTAFNHDSSQYKLTGKHVNVKCADCHYITEAESLKVILKPIDVKCASCHTDPHVGQFDYLVEAGIPDFCTKCHSDSGWKETKFDHNRDSRYLLDGAHIKVACNKCHPVFKNEQDITYIFYKPLGMECADCHGKTIPVEQAK